MANVMLSSAFEPASVVFNPCEKNKMGGKFVPVSTDPEGKKRVVIQTPPLSVPFGVSPYQDATTGEVQSYSVDVSFRGAESDARIAAFLAKMRDLDAIILTKAVENSTAWFGKAMSEDIVAEFYRRLVRDPANPQYAPTMKCKVALSNGQPNAAFFDEDRAPVGIDAVTKGCTVKLILELQAVWFVSKTFGVTWKVLQCAVCNRPRRLQGYAFADDGGEAAATASPDFLDDDNDAAAPAEI